MNRKEFVYPMQDIAFEKYREGILLQKDIESVYNDNEYKMKQPDLLGKTVRVTEKQFGNVHNIMKNICKDMDGNIPPVYVYEEYYYGAESYGISNHWIEISAKTVTDFTEDELTFVLAREVYKIMDGITKQKTMMEMVKVWQLQVSLFHQLDF